MRITSRLICQQGGRAGRMLFSRLFGEFCLLPADAIGTRVEAHVGIVHARGLMPLAALCLRQFLLPGSQVAHAVVLLGMASCHSAAPPPP